MYIPRPLPTTNTARALTLSVLVLLSGCTTLGPDFEPAKVDAPASWTDWHSGGQSLDELTIDSSTVPAERWWREFEDPVLDRLEQRLLEASPDLQSALLNFTRSRLQRQVAVSARGVAIDASGGANRQKLSEHGAQVRMAAISAPANKDALISALAEPYTLYQVGFDAGWELDLWGRISRRIESAEADSRASAALLAQAWLGLTAELARNYFELRALQRQRALLEAEIANGEDQLALLEANRDAGLVREQALDSQRIQLDELRAGLPPLGRRSVETANAIALMLGGRPGSVGGLLDANGSTNEPIPNTDLSLGLPSELARRRPDIRVAEAQLHAATADIGVAMGDLYPRITLQAGLGLESYEQGAFADWASRRWSIGPGFYLPIFNQGRLKTRVELTKVAQQQAAVSYQQTILKAWQEVDNALSAYSAEQSRYRQLQGKLESALSQHRLIAANRQAGLVDTSVELQAQRQVLLVERQLVESRAALRIQRIAVYKAVGGGIDSQQTTDEQGGEDES
ncbi:outer membrane efflux protein [Marinobacterium zhoushanense]|uniref:Outer membrane efflux protein n=1 Tax=Marinobacterium zhoushanense TaxID=1679163 RepID=A0ABQ1KS67_9GAMM|nr:efflux transporter outer membrane subunit [Marinobacterium zhoushanense]GGC05029.1 outer membrane efflux protein [Marinobacterium zhoushanense]